MTVKTAAIAAAVLFTSYQSALAFDEADVITPGEQPPAAPAAAPAEPSGTPAARVDRLAAPSSAQSTRLRLGEIPVAASIDLTVPAADLWQRIRNGFALPDIDGPLVREQESWYASRPDYVKRMVARSQRYLYYIVEEVEKRSMPSEIALLPMIESAYNPTAYSRSHASGIWQFIPSTGKLYGLQQDWWQDERRDVLAATRAALDYLEKLYDQFGSWDLALAAYNWGEGALSRAIARNQAQGLPTDYMSLNMPKETRGYVPKLQAVKNIVAHPGQFGLDLAQIQNQPYFTAVSVPQHIDVKLAARLAEMPLDEFLSLNPAHNRPVIRSEGGQLLLPTDKANVFTTNLERHDQPLVSWQMYTLKKGETLEKIAARFGIGVAQLRQINDLPVRHKRSLAGQHLLVPMRNLAGTSNLDKFQAAVAEAPTVAVATPHASSRLHVVGKGETLFGIARRYGVSIQQLNSWNTLHADRIALGQRLIVGQGQPVVASHAKVRVATAKRAAKAQPAKGVRVSTSAAAKTRVFVALTPTRKRQ